MDLLNYWMNVGKRMERKIDGRSSQHVFGGKYGKRGTQDIFNRSFFSFGFALLMM